MKPSLQLCPVSRTGMMKVSATLQDPYVRLEGWDATMPLLSVSDGGVEVALEFVDRAAFRSFQHQVAAQRLPEDGDDA